MSKPTVRISIPTGSPDKMITLGDLLENRHTKMGADSPLKMLDMKTFDEKLKSAKEKHDMAQKLHKQAEMLNQQAYSELGIEKWQNSKTQGTVFNFIAIIRDILRGIYRGQEESLSEWGFNVVCGSVTKKKKKQV